MQNILIIGATSAIAEATARIYAQRGDKLYLFARNQERLITIAEDLKIRGASSIDYGQLDVNDFEAHENIINTVFKTFGKVDIVLIAHGTLPDQKACENNFNMTLLELNTNAISTISLLTHITNKLELQKCGVIAVITSVAGDRGRQSNYVYGAAKGMVSVFLQGLRNRLHKSGVNVLDIKPGFIDTPMTAEFKKGILWAKPAMIAKVIVEAVDNHKHEIYTPYFWRYIMFIIRNIPEIIFRKLKL
ncbi:MAG: short-chain dehydrogenase [endosymbiont of Galathealinum brachiosum]|uniref:Short-chain dehydrogenase n=1 Tax=endosymbiont of Galathealinum brachiosum TaxID=2200906 RepID=A0A370D8W6_9GAMM|nr:MAG: short-chain dehydrogenase [endosymbiont of Galathealinum brachiosum]